MVYIIPDRGVSKRVKNKNILILKLTPWKIEILQKRFAKLENYKLLFFCIPKKLIIREVIFFMFFFSRL